MWKMPFAKTPKIIQIETTIACNATCWFCPQKHATRKPMFMEEKNWKKIIDETRDLGMIYRPFILNEPFVDKRMEKIIEYIKEDKTAKVEFNTNGEPLTPKRTDKFIELGVDIMRFSIDGFYKSTFNEARGISYDKVYSNVKYFLDQSNQSNKKILTEVRMIKLPGTDKEQIEFKNYWEQFNPNEIVFTDLYRYPWEGQESSIQKPCLKILDQMFFYVDGRATLCCWDSKERQIVGDISTQSVMEIWDSEIMKKCRNLLDQGKRDEINLCSRCDAYENLSFDQYLI